MEEIIINGISYALNFGMGFLRDINKSVQMPVDGVPGVKNNVGLRYAVGNLIDGSVEELVEVLFLANKNQNPRLTRELLDSWVDDPCTDIDAAFNQVMDFLRNSNATKHEVAMMENAVQQQMTE